MLLNRSYENAVTKNCDKCHTCDGKDPIINLISPALRVKSEHATGVGTVMLPRKTTRLDYRLGQNISCSGFGCEETHKGTGPSGILFIHEFSISCIGAAIRAAGDETFR